MSSILYLARLAEKLRGGLGRLPASFRDREAVWLQGAQNADGGFGGRQGLSDLYYTGFALRGADMLQMDEPRFWQGAAAFVRKAAPPPADVSDVLSVLLSRAVLELHGQTLWCETCAPEREGSVRKTLDEFRTAGGGFSKVRGGPPSLYHTFLAIACLELLGEPAPDGDVLARRVLSSQAPDGGFGDLSHSSAVGTNPAAAAVALLGVLGALEGDVSAHATAFLLTMQRPDGGFTAHRAAPASDLMSTFTALTTLSDMGTLGRVRLGDAGRFVRSLALSGGGFLSAAMDDATDVEYTYYGLGCLALLAGFAASPPACTRKEPGCCGGSAR